MGRARDFLSFPARSCGSCLGQSVPGQPRILLGMQETYSEGAASSSAIRRATDGDRFRPPIRPSGFLDNPPLNRWGRALGPTGHTSSYRLSAGQAETMRESFQSRQPPNPHLFTGKSKVESRNLKLEIGNLKFEARSSKFRIPSPRFLIFNSQFLIPSPEPRVPESRAPESRVPRSRTRPFDNHRPAT